MDREEWMYKLPRVGNDLSFLHHVTKFIAAVKKRRVSRGEELTICPCRSGKNKLLHEDNVMQSHLLEAVALPALVKVYVVVPPPLLPTFSLLLPLQPGSDLV